MILWIVKLLGSVRQAIAGRKYPHQLAWAVAFGLLLGAVPHGNLLAIGLLIVVLSLRINHAMVGLTAVGTTFLATKLDPYSHQVGQYVLEHPTLGKAATDAWQLPLMPWTDLNNTVVLGSFLIGVGALVPVFVVTYPMFRWLAPAEPALEIELGNVDLASPRDARSADSHPLVLIDRAHSSMRSPHSDSPHGDSSHGTGSGSPTTPSIGTDLPTEADFTEIDSEPPENRVAVETRIDVIRMKDYRSSQPESVQADTADSQQPMDEALNYLLRQLRDSQQRKAA